MDGLVKSNQLISRDESMHCLMEGTMISIDGFTSVPIETLINSDNEVMSYNIEKKGIEYEKQTNFMFQGEKQCIELTFEDGRKLSCTPDHKIYTTNGWKEAQNIILNEDDILVAPENPSFVKIETDYKEEKTWNIDIGSYNFSTDTQLNIKKATAFARILGYLLTDGTLYKGKFSMIAVLYMGHMIDAKTIQKDIELAFNHKPIITFREGCYNISLCSTIAKALSQIDGILIGKRTIQPAKNPTFIQTAPRIIVMNYLAGLFGGDGVAPSSKIQPSKKTIIKSEVGFIFSKVHTENDSAINYQNEIINMLSKFGIKAEISAKVKLPIKKDGLLKYKHELFIRSSENVSKFYRNIGFAHCMTKHMRLAAANSIIELRNSIITQNEEISKNFDKITNYSQIVKQTINLNLTKSAKAAYINKHMNNSLDVSRKQAIDEWKLNNPLYGHIKSVSSIRDGLISKTDGTVPFVDDGEILKKWNAYNYFRNDDNISTTITNQNNDINIQKKHTDTAYAISRTDEVIPCMKMKIIYRKNIGIRKTYDITINKNHNFTANGVVVHNCQFACMLYKMLVNKLDEKKVHAIVYESVEISKIFVKDAIKCHMIGMNLELMNEYIQYMGDTLLVMLGHNKIYNNTNPFGFMESIGLLNKTNFFESRPTEYQAAFNAKNTAKQSITILNDF
jgi:ribonucleotide reductase beta subunit family protein with ferritin-like domain